MLKNTTSLKHVKKSDRELKVLIGLIELYIKTGKPVGSHTLQEHGFADLSSATLRNYFAKLEEHGYLTQQHSSGGRIPTELGYRFYARESLVQSSIEESTEKEIRLLLKTEVKEPAHYLNRACELLSKLSGLASFISSPRFDHDYIIDIRLTSLDAFRCLAIMITQFGLVQTEVLHTEKKISSLALKRIESYCQERLRGKLASFAKLDSEEEKIAISFYHEAIIRYIVGHANFSQADLFKTGFSELLRYPEFNDPQALALGLSLFENQSNFGFLLQDAMKESLSFLIGSDLNSKYNIPFNHSAVLTIPYFLNQTPVGAIGVLGPMRIPYKRLFAILKVFSAYLSESLTKSLYRFKLHYRQPNIGSTYLEQEERLFLDKPYPILLEDRRE